MRWTRFLRSRPRAHGWDTKIEGLDAFRSESATEPGRKPARLTVRGRLVSVLAALAIVEAVPAGLWLYQTIRSSAILQPATAAAAPIPTSAAAATNSRSDERREADEPKPGVTAPPVAARGTDSGAPAGTAGAKASSPAVQGPVAGLITVSAPVPMHIYSRGRVVGTTRADTIMLPVGKHELVFINEDVGYTARRSVNVQPGRTTRIELESPTGTVNVNASPWAEVWVDDRRIGETPLANLQLPIGRREFVFRHPELGERRSAAFVTLKEPSRISMDMRTK